MAGLVAERVSELLPNSDELGEYEDAYFDWMGDLLLIEEDNRMFNAKAAELTGVFAEAGMRTCVLKGQGAAQLYPEPSR